MPDPTPAQPANLTFSGTELDMSEISRSEAFELATQYNARERMGARVREVLLLNELQGREPSLYAESLEGCWIAYVEREDWGRLIESLIILIDKNDGSIRYAGGAGDEG